jgi:hypothetical protein
MQCYASAMGFYGCYGHYGQLRLGYGFPDAPGSNIVKGVKIFAEKALINLAEAHHAIIEARMFSTIQANKHRREDSVITEEMLVFGFCRLRSIYRTRTTLSLYYPSQASDSLSLSLLNHPSDAILHAVFLDSYCHRFMPCNANALSNFTVPSRVA